MINRLGTRKVDDYVTHLEQRRVNKLKDRHFVDNSLRLTYEELRKDIESEFDENEHVEKEDEEGFRFLGELLKSAYSAVKDVTNFITLQIRLAMVAVRTPDKLPSHHIGPGGHTILTQHADPSEATSSKHNAGADLEHGL
eukprot:gene46717-58249_t